MRSGLVFFIFIGSLIGSLAAFEDFRQLSFSPQLYVCDHFLSEEECDHIIEIASHSLSRSTVVDLRGGEGQIDTRRTSLGTWISSEADDPIVRGILRRISEITKIPEKNGESIQVLYYGIKGEYQPHYDYFDQATEGGLAQWIRGGQRVATFMIYLNTVEEGGETIFPCINLKVTPEKGKAVLFYNVNSDGKEDPMSFHGGAPVIQGEKWLMTRWLREREFH